MKRSTLFVLSAAAVSVAACSDAPTQVVPADEIPSELLSPSLEIVDAGHGASGNPHFYWLPPVVSKPDYDGVADPTLFPTLEICPRNAAGTDCGGPLLASLTRDQGLDEDRIKIDGKGHYFAHWRMEWFPPQLNGIYRIRVAVQGLELGHFDAIVLRETQVKAYLRNSDGSIYPVSNEGAFKIPFRIEEGALQSFCDFDEDGDVVNCSVGVERAGDGLPTTVVVTTSDAGIAGVLEAPDGVFLDANGQTIPEVVVAMELEVGPPSQDLLLDDAAELPFFIEINTFPSGVHIDPDRPGVHVVICQDEPELEARGIAAGLHTQLVLYKVGKPNAAFPEGQTRRLPTTFGAAECEDGGAPAPMSASTAGLVGMLRLGATRLLDLVTPEPALARRLHGGLNTVVTSDVSLDEAPVIRFNSRLGQSAVGVPATGPAPSAAAGTSGSTGGSGPFSTFGSVLGPNALSSSATVPGGLGGSPTTMLIQVRDALGADFPFGGDQIDVSVTSGPNAGAPVTVTDNGDGTYTAVYVPSAPGTDFITIELTTADGWAQGEIGGSPYESLVVPPFLITRLLPELQVAPGHGQMLSIEGIDFPAAPTVEFIQGETTLTGFVYAASPTLIVVRPPTSGLATTQAGVPSYVRVGSPQAYSNAEHIRMSTVPGTPIITALYEALWTPTAPPPGDVCGGPRTLSDGTLARNASSGVWVQAHGLDLTGGQIRIEQENTARILTPTCADMAPVGIFARIHDDEEGDDEQPSRALKIGPAQLRVRTQVNGVFSPWSDPVDITVSGS